MLVSSIEPLLFTLCGLDAEVEEYPAEELEIVAKLGSGEQGVLDLENHDNKMSLTLNQYDKLRLTLRHKGS